VFAVAAGAFGPIYLNSADQSILNTVLRAAPPGNTGLTFEASTGAGSPPRLLAAAAGIPQRRKWWGNTLSTDLAGVTLMGGNQPYAASLMSRTDVCAHLTMVSGHCADRVGAVVISTRTAQELGVKLGQSLTASFVRSPRTVTLRIIGLYRARSGVAPFWWGANPFAFGTGPPARPSLDAIFASAQTIRAAAPPSLVSYMVQVPYRQGALALHDTPAFESTITSYEHELLTSDGIILTTQLLPLLSRAAIIEHTTATIVAVIVLQLVLLAVYALYFVSARTAAEREADVRLAAIRGFRPRSTIAVAMLEPTAIVVTAVPVGLLVAWLVAYVGAASLFGSGVGATMTALALGAAVLTGLCGVGATFLGTRRMLSTVEPSSNSPSGQRFSTWAVVADVAAVAIAGAAFVELAAAGVSGTSGASHTDPLAAFAPGLLALALGILGARLLPVLLRSTFPYTTHSNRLALTLATRRVARLREFAPQVVLLSIAVGLTVFGITGWATAARNRDVQSEFGVGAAKVFTVTVRPGVNFLSAVRRADDEGDSAMAAVVENASNGTTLAVDSTRMKDVASWPGGLGAGGAKAVARRLVPSHLAPPVMVSGTAVRLSLVANVAAQPPPELSLDLFDEGFQTPQQVTLGTLSSGRSTYAGSLQGVCPSGCRLVDLALTWAPPVTSAAPPVGTADLLVDSLSVRSSAGRWEPLRAGLTDVRRWYNPSGGARLSSQAHGLRAAVSLDPSAGPVTLAPADVPIPLPAVVTPDSSPGSDSGLFLAGLDGGTVRARAVGQVPALPRLGDGASLVDLAMAERVMTGPFVYDSTEVWVSAAAPADLVQRLAAQGVAVANVDSVSGRETASVHGGTELAYTLFLLSSIAAATLAIGATAFAVAAGARRREGELAALRAIGVPPARLRRSLEVEMGLVLGTGVLLGAGAGIVAAVVALKSVPEFVALGPGPPLEMGLPGFLLVVTLGALILALGATVRLGAAVFVRQASAETLGGTVA
jgi:hypothetical protein